jgi:hypothetical protein
MTLRSALCLLVVRFAAFLPLFPCDCLLSRVDASCCCLKPVLPAVQSFVLDSCLFVYMLSFEPFFLSLQTVFCRCTLRNSPGFQLAASYFLECYSFLSFVHVATPQGDINMSRDGPNLQRKA